MITFKAQIVMIKMLHVEFFGQLKTTGQDIFVLLVSEPEIRIMMNELAFDAIAITHVFSGV
jgi:hypothetical protein